MSSGVEPFDQRSDCTPSEKDQPALSLQGNLDICDDHRLAGWAFDKRQPGSPVPLLILADGQVVGRVLADRYRADVAKVGCFGDGNCGFAFRIPLRLSPESDHLVEVCHADDRTPLPGSPKTVPALSPVEVVPPEVVSLRTDPLSDSEINITKAVRPHLSLEGSIDRCTGFLLEGWALDRSQLGSSVRLEILVDGELIGHVVANRYREDIFKSGRFGDGFCGFGLDMPVRLKPGVEHLIEVRRADDGTPLPGSPKIVPAFSRFDAEYQNDLEKVLHDTLLTVEQPTDLDEPILFLGRQTEALLAARAQLERGTAAVAYPYDRWAGFAPSPAVRSAASAIRPQALFITTDYPLIGRSSGSNAVLEHMRSLTRLGFDVRFAASEDLADRNGAAAALLAAGITPLVAPWYSSIEEVLRRAGQPSDLVYLHRIDTAWPYHALVRRYCPRALVIYSVGELRHLRLARQAKILDVPSYGVSARGFRTRELAAAQLVDLVITHSPFEAELLRRLPKVKVMTLPWSVPVRKRPIAFSDRAGVAFIGGFGHDPNLDAVYYLAEQIAPLVRKDKPSMTFRVFGGQRERLPRSMPPLEFVGEADDLGAVFDTVLLTVAPLRFEAGLNSMVIDSLAAGVPCIGTSIAYEGMNPPDVVRACVADTPEALAAALLRLSGNQRAYAECAEAGRLYVKNTYSEARIDACIREVVDPVFARWERITQMQPGEPVNS